MPLNSLAQSVPVQNRRRKKTQYSLFAVFYGLSLTAFLFVALGQATDAIGDYPLEILLCFIIGGLSIYGQLLSLRREASIHFVSFIFCFLFMSAAPIVQIGADIDPVFRIDHWALWAVVNALAFTAIGVFITYRVKKPDDKMSSRPIVAPSGYNYFSVFLVTAVTSGIAITLYRDSLFTNREDFSAAVIALFGDQITALLAKTFLSVLPFFGAIIGLRSSIANRQKIWIVLFSLIMLAVAMINNPLINPRYQLAGLGFFAIDYMFYGKRTKLLAVMLIVGVLIAPALQAVRTSDSISESSITEDTGLFSNTLLSMDYDAFRLSCYTMLTVDKAGISWGSNLLGAALFFVPRSWWPEKPPQTSWVVYETMTHTYDVGTSNLSTPLMAEGYYAFGWVGALSISILYWWVVSRITLLSRKDAYSWTFLSRCVFAGLVLIFLRGTLIVGVSAVVGSLVAAAIPAILIRRRLK